MKIVVNASQSTIGTDFVFGFINNWNGAYGSLRVYVSNANDESANVTITSIYGLNETVPNVIVSANSVETVIEK